MSTRSIIVIEQIFMGSPGSFMKKLPRRILPRIYDFKKIWRPALFQGTLERKNYFEGWYFKLVSPGGAHKMSFIPGISLGKDPHSFVQVINGNTGETIYYRFEIDDFSYSEDAFYVQIGKNLFSESFMQIDLDNQQRKFKGKIEFGVFKKHPVNFLRPGIMGWYRFVPFMECYHGVVSLGHGLKGCIVANENNICFDQGKGYIEKDWGKSMPQAWVWMQGNAFDTHPDASFMLSVARIPWMGGSFTGFLGYLDTGSVFYSFATYTGTKITSLYNDSDRVEIILEDRRMRLAVSGLKGERGNLKAPVQGNMERVIHESLNGQIQISLVDKKTGSHFRGITNHAGLELVGDPALLQ